LNLRRRCQQIYSLPPLATREPLHSTNTIFKIYKLFLSGWSRRWDLNPQPADYKSAALPLSYVGTLEILVVARNICYLSRILAGCQYYFKIFC
jgi:hypothetical protein